MEPTEFLVCAKFLEQNLALSPAFGRSAISRAYYATFHQALSVAKKFGYVSSAIGQGSHRDLWVWFDRQGRAYREIVLIGLEMHGDRVKADYQIERPIPVNAQNSIVTAEKLFRLLLEAEANLLRKFSVE